MNGRLGESGCYIVAAADAAAVAVAGVGIVNVNGNRVGCEVGDDAPGRWALWYLTSADYLKSSRTPQYW